MIFSDQQLTRRTLSGDHAAFGTLYDRHSPCVFGLLRKLTGDATEAEDLTQETFLAAYHALGSWRGAGKFGTWLCGIAFRLYANRRRREMGRETEPLDEECILMAPDSDPLLACIRREAEQSIEAAIQALPPICREVFVLVKVEGLSYREVAEWLNVPLLFKETLTTRAVEQETAAEIVFATENDMDQHQKHDIYTISKRTWLPVRYEVRAENGAAAEIVEHLEAEYDQPLIATLTRLEWPANYLVVDGDGAAESAELPRDNVVRDGSLTVQLTPLAMDAQGRILARVRGWLGSVRITSRAFYMHVVQWPCINPQEVLQSTVDDRKRPYIMVPVEGLRLIADMNPGVDHLVYLAPFKPLPQHAPLPRRLKVMLRVAPWTSVKQSGMGKDTVLQQCILMSTNLIWNVDLPTQPTSLDPDAYLPAGWRERVKTTGTDIPPLDASVASARAQLQQALPPHGRP